jgi:hypothetical protein
MMLLIQYVWHLTAKDCPVTFRYGPSASGPTTMLAKIGALDLQGVLLNDGQDFGPRRGTAFALRRRSDVQNAINIVRRVIQGYSVGFPEYLSYIIAELLYNATEHGRRTAQVSGATVIVPAVFQYGYYPTLHRLAFLFSDLGVGIKQHLEQTYPPFATHQDAITFALRPNVSGTFRAQEGPYASRNNAGMGLTYSSLMLKKLRGDMYIISHSGQVHVSEADATTHLLRSPWPGTYVYIALNLATLASVDVKELLAEIRANAEREVENSNQEENAGRYVVSIYNYFGRWAEDKDAVIQFRDRHLLPAIREGKRVDLDFRDVVSAPHSFLNALIADAIKELGPRAYQRIRVYNAPGEIREIIDQIFEQHIPEMR